MTMILNVPGATIEEIARGLRAAQKVLDAARVTDVQAAWAKFEYEGWDINYDFDPKHKPKAGTLEAAIALSDARAAALRACCAGWERQSEDWSLDVDVRGR